MFTLPSKDNPLAALLGKGIGGGIENRVNSYKQDNISKRRNEELNQAFESLNDTSSPMDVLKAIEGLRYSDDDTKKRLYSGIEAIGKEKEAKSRGQQEQLKAKKIAQLYGLDPEEIEGLGPKEVENLGKNRSRTLPASQQAPSPEMTENIKKIVESNKEKNPIELDIALREGGVPKTDRDSIIESQRREREHQDKVLRESPENKREERISQEQAKADVDYNSKLQEASKTHESKKKTLLNLQKLNREGVTGLAYEKLLEKFGLTFLTSEGRREFASGQKNLITDVKSILGGQFSQFEFQTVLNASPSPDFSKEANEAIIRNLLDFEDIKEKEVQFGEDLKKENKGKIPVDFQSKVNERVKEYAASKLPDIKERTQKIMNEEYGINPGHVLMFDNKGNPLSVPKEQVQKYIDLGAILP